MPPGALTDYSIEAEMRSCFENIRMVLAAMPAAAGKASSTCHVLPHGHEAETGRPTTASTAEFFPPGPHQPTRTTVEVTALPTGGNTPIHFEIKVIATVE
jgi:enamine deaminase RidA (YjgF/YER057c/UK114 family)